jgi:cell division protein FtsB|tara:strand:- start:506 stop:703 length:198 start_codon:yes stop_codon:yes gene_type:complete
MTNPYPKPRWDLENDVLRLEQMIILYEQEIAELTTEKEKLKEEVTLLRRRLKYYKTIVEVDEEEK